MHPKNRVGMLSLSAVHSIYIHDHSGTGVLEEAQAQAANARVEDTFPGRGYILGPLPTTIVDITLNSCWSLWL